MVTSCPSLSGASKQPFSGAPQPSSGIVTAGAYSQVLQHLLQESRLEIPALVTVQFSQDPKVAEVVGH
jgi:hypothetical protein